MNPWDYQLEKDSSHYRGNQFSPWPVQLPERNLLSSGTSDVFPQSLSLCGVAHNRYTLTHNPVLLYIMLLQRGWRFYFIGEDKKPGKWRRCYVSVLLFFTHISLMCCSVTQKSMSFNGLYHFSQWIFFTWFSSVAQSCPTLCDPMDCRTPGFPVHHQLPELAKTHTHWVSDAIQPCHPLLCPFPPAFSLSQLQNLFQRVSSLHQVAKVLEFQLQHQSFQWIFMTDFL